MDDTAVKEAAALLRRHWAAGTRLPALPEGLRPATQAEGHAIQALFSPAEAVPFGWKIAATSRAGQMHIGVDGPIAGRLPPGRIHGDGAVLSLAGNAMRVAEPEFAFRMAVDLPPRATPYAVDEVLDAVATLHPAIEVPDSRFEDFARVGAASLIAEAACAHDFVLGAATEAAWREFDLSAYPVHVEAAGRPALAGSGANVLGDPRVALTWLVNELSRLGITLAAGEVVTTGTCTTPLPLRPGDTVTASFGAVGRVAVSFLP